MLLGAASAAEEIQAAPAAFPAWWWKVGKQGPGSSHDWLAGAIELLLRLLINRSIWREAAGEAGHVADADQAVASDVKAQGDACDRSTEALSEGADSNGRV